MLFKKNVIDERVRRSVGRWSVAWLGITQLMLFGVLMYRLYIIGQPDRELSDFRVVLAISVLGAAALHLYLGGMLPVPTWKGAVLVYVVLFGAIAGVSIAVHGVPARSEFASTWLPGILGPAIFVGIYWGVSVLGERRITKIIGDDDAE